MTDLLAKALQSARLHAILFTNVIQFVQQSIYIAGGFSSLIQK